jgi:hypothetical protein
MIALPQRAIRRPTPQFAENFILRGEEAVQWRNISESENCHHERSEGSAFRWAGLSDGQQARDAGHRTKLVPLNKMGGALL